MKKYILYLLGFTFLFLLPLSAQEKEMSSEEAWLAIQTYEYGNDLQPLLIVTNEVQKATASFETQKEMAAKLGAMLNDKTSYPGRQFICDQLRLVGTAAEVPVLTKYLHSKEDSVNARLALSDIHCEESLISLRNALKTTQGRTLAGIISILAVRNDLESMDIIASFCESEDPMIAQSAVEALGSFGEDAYELLKNIKPNVSQVCLESAFLNIAVSLAESKKTEKANEILNMLILPDATRGTRRAAFQEILNMASDNEKSQLIFDWFFENDSEKNIIAASHLKVLSPEALKTLYARYEQMSSQAQTIIMEVLVDQNDETMFQNALQAVRSEDLSLRLTAIRTLGRFGNVSALPVLIDALQSDERTQTAIKETLRSFPQEIVCPLLIDALNKPVIGIQAMDCLADMKYYDAIDPLLQQARSDDEKIYLAAIDALTRICDPDSYDMPRLLSLYFESRRGKHRESTERMIVIVCEKNSEPSQRVDVILESLEKRDGGLEPVLNAVFPLLGKLGNDKIYQLIKNNLKSDDNIRQSAAMRAFCNWPNADPLDELWNIAEKDKSQIYQQWALRAYIRLATLKSDRQETETLEMLKRAMNIAKTNDDKRLCLMRTSTVRIIESVDWVSGYLDDPEMLETAAKTIVELAHHRFLREPNKEKFLPVLLKIEKMSQNSDIVEQAEKARLGM